MRKYRKVITLEEFINNDYVKQDFKENINIAEDIQFYCEQMMAVNIQSDIFKQFKNVDENLLKLLILAERLHGLKEEEEEED